MVSAHRGLQEAIALQLQTSTEDLRAGLAHHFEALVHVAEAGLAAGDRGCSRVIRHPTARALWRDFVGPAVEAVAVSTLHACLAAFLRDALRLSPVDVDALLPPDTGLCLAHALDQDQDTRVSVVELDAGMRPWDAPFLDVVQGLLARGRRPLAAFPPLPPSPSFGHTTELASVLEALARRGRPVLERGDAGVKVGHTMAPTGRGPASGQVQDDPLRPGSTASPPGGAGQPPIQQPPISAGSAPVYYVVSGQPKAGLSHFGVRVAHGARALGTWSGGVVLAVLPPRAPPQVAPSTSGGGTFRGSGAQTGGTTSSAASLSARGIATNGTGPSLGAVGVQTVHTVHTVQPGPAGPAGNAGGTLDLLGRLPRLPLHHPALDASGVPQSAAQLSQTATIPEPEGSGVGIGGSGDGDGDGNILVGPLCAAINLPPNMHSLRRWCHSRTTSHLPVLVVVDAGQHTALDLVIHMAQVGLVGQAQMGITTLAGSSDSESVATCAPVEPATSSASPASAITVLVLTSMSSNSWRGPEVGAGWALSSAGAGLGGCTLHLAHLEGLPHTDALAMARHLQPSLSSAQWDMVVALTCGLPAALHAMCSAPAANLRQALLGVAALASGQRGGPIGRRAHAAGTLAAGPHIVTTLSRGTSGTLTSAPGSGASRSRDPAETAHQWAYTQQQALLCALASEAGPLVLALAALPAVPVHLVPHVLNTMAAVTGRGDSLPVRGSGQESTYRPGARGEPYPSATDARPAPNAPASGLDGTLSGSHQQHPVEPWERHVDALVAQGLCSAELGGTALVAAPYVRYTCTSLGLVPHSLWLHCLRLVGAAGCDALQGVQELYLAGLHASARSFLQQHQALVDCCMDLGAQGHLGAVPSPLLRRLASLPGEACIHWLRCFCRQLPWPQAGT